jgi:glycosyltransferase involved in cell wall biosynthesis
MNKLSIVMPVYNEAATVEEVVQAVLKQESVQELVIVDDGSSDGTWAQLEKLKNTDSRINIIRQDVNRGKGSALQMGFQNASGDIVGIQDADLARSIHKNGLAARFPEGFCESGTEKEF